MIEMFDSIEVSVLPSSARAVAGYVDGRWPTFGALTQRFYGHAHCLSITVFGAPAACCDCENGDMTPAQAEAWVARELARGRWRPVVYANLSTWEGGLRANLAHYGKRIRRWVAHYDGIRSIPEGYDAKQYNDHGPHGQNYDLSVCRDDFFPGEAPLPHPRPTHKPHPKVTAAGISGALTTALIAFLNARGIHVTHLTPPESAAIATAAAAIAGYLKRGGYV